MRVIVSGGGTAGHIYPGLALLKALASGNAVAEVLYIGSHDGLEAPMIKSAGYPLEGLDVSGLPRKVSLSGVTAMVKMAKAVRKARGLLRRFNPDVVVGTGAYVSVPVVLAAALARIPTIIHEQNALPGLANRLLGRFATAIAITYPETKNFFPKKNRVELTGNPVRENILAADGVSARKIFDLDPLDPVLFIFGGSRGARRLNDAAIGGIGKLLDLGIQVIHSTGEVDFERVKEAIGELADKRYLVLPYIDDMGCVYSAADLVVSRAGATTVAEITASGVASLLVPYPYATGKHQEKNARALIEAGATKVIADKDLTSERLVTEVSDLIKNKPELNRMAEAAKRLGRPDAAKKLAELVKRVATGRKR
ncbi:MAG: undecaprenyldiphospho-muramoylpentapeptide beta-N-acetylglucosaminyltransferase [Chloroflexi bacterium]|nr:undecaprenyldiphospho-muramoylpentapeptide beta-N-acetylglucosaminyltransferase [Chloroflexota bacterium]